MPIKKILVPVQNLETAEAGLKAAISLAKSRGGHIDALHVRQRPNIPASGYYPIGVVFVDEQLGELNAALEAQAVKLRGVFDRVAREAGVQVRAAGDRGAESGATASFRDQAGVLPMDLSSAARVADLVAFGRGDGEAGVPDAGLIEEAIFQSGRPVLIAPEGKLEADPRRILIAWNGGREAARALTASLDLLARAEAVAVLTLGDPSANLEGPEAAADLLRLHAVAAEAMRRGGGGGISLEDELLAAARDWRADLIVMGAYSHSRWREIVLGGFTRKLLKQSEFPLLLAH